MRGKDRCIQGESEERVGEGGREGGRERARRERERKTDV